MNITKMYYDAFANEYTLEREEIAPPERYLETLRGDDIYIEKWSIGNGLFIDVAYSQYDVDNWYVNKIRHSQEQKHNCILSHMMRWTIPAVKFDEYVKRFGLEDNDE